MRQKNKIWTQPLDGEKHEEQQGFLWQQGSCSGRGHKWTGARQGRSQEELTPSPLPQGAGGPASSTCQAQPQGLTKNTPMCKLLLLSCCFPAAAPGQACGSSALSGAGRRSPAGSWSRSSTQGSAGCSLQREKMQLHPADLGFFWHVKEWHCCSKYLWETGNKIGFFSFWIRKHNICPRAQIMHWNEELSRQVGGNLFNIFSATCWPSLCVGCV